MLLARTEVLPHYTQVEISDPAKTDYPQWATGKEPAVATPQCIAVAARPDHLGNVAIELWQDEMNHTSLSLQLVYEGELIVTTNRIHIGNLVGANSVDVPLSAGRYHVKVFTSPTEGPAETIRFLITGANR